MVNEYVRRARNAYSAYDDCVVSVRAHSFFHFNWSIVFFILASVSVKAKRKCPLIESI